jgi:hypothetical protein
MQKPAFLALLVGLGFLLGACQKEVEGFDLPESDAKLVVHCFISPQDDYLTASVTRSVPILGAGNPADTLVKDAAVTLSDGVRSVLLPYDRDQKAYTRSVWTAREGDLEIKPGTSYRLQVTTPRGETATATCTVPTELNLPITVSPDSAWDAFTQQYYHRMRVSWPDPPGQVNYYRVAGWKEEVTSVSADGRPTGIGHSPAHWEAEETISDQGQDGLRLVSPRAQWRGSGFQSPLRTSLNAHLLHTDPHYYHYYRSVRRAKQSQANPFAEPVLVYSNVTGGLGVFGAFTRTTTSVRIR